MKRTTIPAALSLLLAGSFALGSPAHAQQPQAPASSDPSAQQPPAPIVRSGGPGMHQHAPDPHREAMMLSRRLNLTPDQTAKLEPILVDREQKMAALRANTSLSPQDMHQQMRAIHQQEQTQFASVLTPEQQEQFKSMHHGGHRGQNQPQQPSA